VFLPLNRRLLALDYVKKLYINNKKNSQKLEKDIEKVDFKIKELMRKKHKL